VQKRADALMDRVIGPRSLLRELPVVLSEALRHPVALLVVMASLLAGLWRQPAVLAKSAVAVWRGLAALPAIRRFDPQWLHAHWATYPSTVAWALSRMSGIPFSFTAHAHDIFVDDQLLAPKLADASLAVTISEFNVRHLGRWGASALGERLQVVHCGVDLAELPPRLDGREARRLLSVGRLDPIKGFDTLLRALGKLRREGVDFHCTVVGEGPERGWLEAILRAEGLEDHVALVGARPQEAVREALYGAAIFLMPSVTTPEGNQDGIPVALMEAMATGAAVVATRVSGLPELVEDGVNGLLVPPRDADALAGAVRRLLEDADLRRRLGTVAHETVARRFDARKEADRLLALVGDRLPAGEGPVDAR
jgi:glycosyltransferase involved in cell wall biosynthesis